MIGEELFEVLGASPVLIAFLALMWKGDEALSKEARKDLSVWLLNVDVPRLSRPWIHATLSSFEKVFGKSPREKKFIIRCVFFTLIAGSLSFLIISRLVPATLFNIFHTGDHRYLNDIIETDLIFYIWIFLILFILNIIPDYLSMSFSHYCLGRVRQEGEFLKWMLIDFFFSIFCIFLTIGIALILAMILDDFVFYYASQTFILSAEAVTETGFLLFASALTAIALSAWIWLAGLGSSFIRLLSKSDRVLKSLQYLLPIKETPVRSIGLCGSVLAAAILVGFNVLSHWN